LKCELRIVTSKASEIGELRNEIVKLNRDLLVEKLQVKALSEELENPLNYHRWRKLEGTDPDTWEMLQKIQTLQKRLIKKTEEVVEKDVVIQEKEKLYVELKNLLARQPGPEVAEQLSIYQQNLKEKTNQMKAMAAELNMYQAQVNEYKYEIERLTRELQEMKRRYYEQKRREQMQREAQNKVSGGFTGVQSSTGPQQRFTGGGYNLAI
jgi:chromosome segregation ATPase